MKWFIVLFFTCWMVPQFLTAGMAMKDQEQVRVWKTFNDAANNKSEEIKFLFFGPIGRLVGMLGLGYGVIQLFLGNKGQMITALGVGLLLTILPSFVDTIFGAMLPG